MEHHTLQDLNRTLCQSEPTKWRPTWIDNLLWEHFTVRKMVVRFKLLSSVNSRTARIFKAASADLERLPSSIGVLL